MPIAMISLWSTSQDYNVKMEDIVFTTQANEPPTQGEDLVGSESHYNLQKRVRSENTEAKFAENSEEIEIESQYRQTSKILTLTSKTFKEHH